MLSGGIQGRALPRHQSEITILNISFLRVGIEPSMCRFVPTLVQNQPLIIIVYIHYQNSIYKISKF